MVATFLISLVLLGVERIPESAFTWATAGDFKIQIGVQIDTLSKGMMLVVTGVGMLVHIFSLGYMKDDEAKARYFGGLSIFMFSDDRDRPRRQFHHDVHLLGAGRVQLLPPHRPLVPEGLRRRGRQEGLPRQPHRRLRIHDRHPHALGDCSGRRSSSARWKDGVPNLPADSGTLVGVAVLLVFCGAVGKSAQFPLHVWLPDAMEGPTPVSALIHAATMVAAGVYMLFRLQVSAGAELFAGFSGDTIAWIGGVTSLLAALMATQQDDIKRVLAYSTLSQLGYMVMAVGLGGHGAEAGEAGMFHLYTHAWFKALLFLGSGAVIYACHHEQDIWKMGGLFQRMPKTTITFAIGTAALMAVPLTSAGFFSKEQILAAAQHYNPALFWIAAARGGPHALLHDAPLRGRLPRQSAAPTARRKQRKSPPVMLVPLLVLAALAVFAGWPFLAKLACARLPPPRVPSQFRLLRLSGSPPRGSRARLPALPRPHLRPPRRPTPSSSSSATSSIFDELYLKLVKFFQDTVAAVVHFFDEFLINGLLVGGLARAACGLGNFFRRLQTGNLQAYATPLRRRSPPRPLPHRLRPLTDDRPPASSFPCSPSSRSSRALTRARPARHATGMLLLAGLALARLLGARRRQGARVLDHRSSPSPSIRLALDLYDGMSVVMMLLSVIVAFAAARSGKCEDRHAPLWYISILLIAAGALGAFLSTDLFFFYAFHELALIPTFLMIGLLGRGDRKEIAWKVTIYLAFGSVVLLAGLLWLVAASGAPSFMAFDDLLQGYRSRRGPARDRPLPHRGLRHPRLPLPLPLLGRSRPTPAPRPPVAMLHAGVLKKFGLYGLLRLYPLVPEGLHSWLDLLIVLLLGNILWVGFVTINQKRLDTMLGNSSVMHMGYVFLAIAALIAAGSETANSIAKPAAILLMFGHGVTVAMLFGLADRIERATGTLELRDLGGLAKRAPSLAFLFGIAAMASLGLPGLANFAGEVMVFIAGFKNWIPGDPFGWVQIATVLAIWGVVISAVYMLRAYRHIFQGGEVSTTQDAPDLEPSDKVPAVLLAVVLLVVGLYPNSILGLLEDPAEKAVVVEQALPEPPSLAVSTTPAPEPVPASEIHEPGTDH